MEKQAVVVWKWRWWFGSDGEEGYMKVCLRKDGRMMCFVDKRWVFGIDQVSTRLTGIRPALFVGDADRSKTLVT